MDNMAILDFVFVVLVYRNTQDLTDFFTHLSIPNAKVIVVNSYYDDLSEKEFKKIATNNGADFISVPNKGYGYGNNRGCEYALAHYKFKYLVISNADVEIKNMCIDLLEKYCHCIVAPKINTLTGKNQNPFMAKHHPFMDKMKNWVFRNNYRFLIRFLSAYSRLEREFYLKIYYPLFKKSSVYAAHGAFVILPYEFIKQNTPIYNERMFLFAEEEHLAQLAKKNNIPIVYMPLIRIVHKEDGSTSLLNNVFEYVRESYLEYYRFWYN